MKTNLSPLTPKTTKKPNWYSRIISQTEIPITVYVAIFTTMTLLWVFQELHEDVTLGLFTELLGAAFTLFIVDTLLVRSKAKRWKIVRTHVDYLIARNVNRLRDGISVRILGFNPEMEGGRNESAQFEDIRLQRARLLSNVETLKASDLNQLMKPETLFTEDTYAYLNEKAGDIWDILNMKYSEYLDPNLVSDLIRLHTLMKDLCGHIRQYLKGERFKDKAAYFQKIGGMGAGVSLREIVIILNDLKENGYSEAAMLTTRDAV